MTFPQICFCYRNKFFWRHDSVFVIGNYFHPEKVSVCNHFGYYGMGLQVGKKWFSTHFGSLLLEDGPTRNFHKNTEEVTPRGRNSGTPRKYPQNTDKIPQNGLLWYLGIFFRGILGVFSGSPEFRPRGVFFRHFSWSSGSGHLGALWKVGAFSILVLVFDFLRLWLRSPSTSKSWGKSAPVCVLFKAS